MTPVQLLIERIRCAPGCVVAPASGRPALRDTERLPDDLRDFYARCGGVNLFTDAVFPIEIVGPARFVRANPEIVGEECPDDISDSWYVIGRDGNEPLITIDCSPARLGRCHDSFWDRHGVAGSCPIVALSFAELLSRLLDREGRDLYWLVDGDLGYGDAYSPAATIR